MTTIYYWQSGGEWLRLQLIHETERSLYFAFFDGSRPGEMWSVARTTMRRYIRDGRMRIEKAPAVQGLG